MAAPKYVARSYAGGAPVATIAAPMGSTDTSFTISPTTGWTSADGHALGTDGPFVIDIDRGLASEEKILCTSINLGTGLVQVYNTGGFLGRGYDQTTATTHTPGGGSPLSGACQLVITAVEALEMNAAVTYLLGSAGGTPSTGNLLSWGAGNAPLWIPAVNSAASAQVSTNEALFNATYTDLATHGPAVTLVTLTSCIVTMTATMSTPSASGPCYMSFAVSGMSTVAAPAGSNGLNFFSNTSEQGSLSCTCIITGLTAGTNTFTAKYSTQAGASTAEFANRTLIVQPLSV